MREDPLDVLVALDQVCAPAAQLRDLTLERVAPFGHVAHEAIPRRARFGHDLPGACTCGFLGVARPLLEHALRGFAQVPRRLLGLAHDAAGVLLGFRPELRGRLPCRPQHPGGLLTQSLQQIVLGERGVRRRELRLECLHSFDQHPFASHGRTELVGDEAEERAHLDFGEPALRRREAAFGDALRRQVRVACRDPRGRGIRHVASIVLAARASTSDFTCRSPSARVLRRSSGVR